VNPFSDETSPHAYTSLSGSWKRNKIIRVVASELVDFSFIRAYVVAKQIVGPQIGRQLRRQLHRMVEYISSRRRVLRAVAYFREDGTTLMILGSDRREATCPTGMSDNKATPPYTSLLISSFC